MNALTHQRQESIIRSPTPPDVAGFRVGAGANFLSGLFAKHPGFWKKMASLETRVLGHQLESIEVNKPVYVTGLARSGTTLLLEILAGHSQVATHQYRDFPALFIPYWWSRSRSKRSPSVATERTHGDKMMITPESPEAMEEMLWMSCFEDLHDPQANQVLDATTSNESFERLYLDHIRKLLLVRGGQRYVAKGNYNLTRMAYLKKILPEARFVIPIRSPESHIASLIKQHRLFTHGETTYPRSLTHMQRVGHFEFGLDLRPINTGNSSEIDSILGLWENGESIRAWARYWASVYDWLHRYLINDPALNDSVKVIRYEDLCAQTSSVLESVLNFVDLRETELISNWENKISPPSYYQSDFSDDERSIIDEETGHVAEMFGY